LAFLGKDEGPYGRLFANTGVASLILYLFLMGVYDMASNYNESTPLFLYIGIVFLLVGAILSFLSLYKKNCIGKENETRIALLGQSPAGAFFFLSKGWKESTFALPFWRKRAKLPPVKEKRFIMELFKKAIAEMIGTCVLVVIGCGVAVATGCVGNAGIVATSLAFGLSIVAMAYSIGNVSGCHINPAVSLGFLVAHKMSFKDFLVYIAAQLVGAILGATILYFIFWQFRGVGNAAYTTQGLLAYANGNGSDLTYGANQIQDVLKHATTTSYGLTTLSVSAGSYVLALLSELVLTFIFVLAILGVTSKTENGTVAGIVIGLVLTFWSTFLASVLPALRSIRLVRLVRRFSLWRMARRSRSKRSGSSSLVRSLGAALAGLVFNKLLAPKAAPAAAK
jgi:aquaporin Z